MANVRFIVDQHMMHLERRRGAVEMSAPRDYISDTHTSAARLLRSKRQHSRIESSLHWILGIALREDASRRRKDLGAPHFAMRSVRPSALNLLKRETACKLGIFDKRLKAAWDPDYVRLSWQRCSNKARLS